MSNKKYQIIYYYTQCVFGYFDFKHRFVVCDYCFIYLYINVSKQVFHSRIIIKKIPQILLFLDSGR